MKSVAIGSVSCNNHCAKPRYRKWYQNLKGLISASLVIKTDILHCMKKRKYKHNTGLGDMAKNGRGIKLQIKIFFNGLDEACVIIHESEKNFQRNK